MSKIVYHGTVEPFAPHAWGHPFHAGTMNAAKDRLNDEINHGMDWAEIGAGIAAVHGYEISNNAPTSRRVWEDPMLPETEGREVPEHKENRIYTYQNAVEDRGSISYVIPSSFVGKHVKHLGVQFQYVIGEKEDENAVMNAITAMSGGKVK